VTDLFGQRQDMNRWIIGSGFVISALVVWVLFSKPEIDSGEVGTMIEEQAQTVPVRPHSVVTYEKTDTPVKPKAKPEVTPAVSPEVEEKLTVDENVLYQGKDVSKRYGFQLIDSAMPPEMDAKKVTIEGEIDGSRFILKIPENAMNDPLQLRIIDLKMKTVKTVELGTASDLKPGGGAARLNMASSDPQSFNVQYDDVNTKVFP